ncbi:MAG: MATE family efflux transporter [Sphaerochaetaceae bacterium]
MTQIDFSNGKTSRNVVQAAVPMLVADLLSLLYNIVDRIYIGRIPGEGTSALAGVGLCFPIITLILAFTNLYGVGGAPICSFERGRGNISKAERVMNTSFLLLLCSGVILTIICLLSMRTLLIAFGASDVTIRYAVPYLRIYLLGTVATMIASGMNPFINAQGFAGVGMLTIFIGAVANIVLDPLFIFVWGMGVRGAAIATVISQGISALIVLVFLVRGPSELKIKPVLFCHVRKREIKDIVGLGFASFIMKFTNSIVALVCNFMLAQYGDLYISIYTIISSVRQILEVPVGAVTDGSSPILSFSYGAKRYDRLKEGIRITTTWAVGYTAVIWVLVLLKPGMFIRIFSSDATVLEHATHAMHLYFFAFLFQSLQSSGQNVFKSLKMKRQAIFFSLFRKVIMVVPLTLLLPHFLGSDGVFLAEPCSNLIGGTACFLTMYFTVYRKLGAT